MQKKWIIIILVLVSIVTSTLFYMGFFKSMRVTEKESGPHYLMYKKHQGAYEELGPIFRALYALAEKQKIKQPIMFGIYYDDPKTVDPNKLRSEVGVALKATDFSRLKASAELKQSGVLFKLLPRYKYAVVEFPFRNMFSIFIGVSKAYPALNEYMQAKGYPLFTYKEKNHEENFALELYEQERIFYFMRLP